MPITITITNASDRKQGINKCWPNNCTFSGTKFGTDHLTNKSGYWANADHAPFDKAVDTK